MFLTKMVKDFLDSLKNSNQQQASEKPQRNQTRTSVSHYKTNRKSNKSKKSHMKSCLNVEDIQDQLPQTSTKKGMNFSSQPNSINKPVIPTKVKSGSWKRSEKSITPFNTFSNKKHKNLRKKSPNWLKFPNSKVKIHESNQLVNESEPTSACRPGTLYSDVLFGAGCSNLVKIKNLTPRLNNNTTTAQKKLTKALFKFSGNHKNDTSDESEIDEKSNLFPALQKTNNNNKIYTSLPTNPTNSSQVVEDSASKDTIFIKELATTSSTSSPTKNQDYEEADVVILSDFKGLCLADNGISYGNYLEGNFPHLNGKVETDAGSSCKDNNFLASSISNIPKWNFMKAETDSDAFPKFLCQFDDENYLKAEKLAWLSLKLALGNNSTQNKSKI
ncbi:uncharacterized protein LOC135961398 [Calliphora vicina]|uniref:uncharacterized protein LOC135961398 n=1 Tax=Calliphora vicina TaxID=7373 RepID=UPI00325A56ED